MGLVLVYAEHGGADTICLVDRGVGLGYRTTATDVVAPLVGVGVELPVESVVERRSRMSSSGFGLRSPGETRIRISTTGASTADIMVFSRTYRPRRHVVRTL